MTTDEALDMLLAEHDRKKAKAAKKAVATQDHGKLAIRVLDEEDTEMQPPGVAAAKLKTTQVVSTGLVKKKLKTKSAAGASGSQRRKKYVA